MILATIDLQVTSILPMNFESIALSVQEKKFKTDFQDGRHGRNLEFPFATIWAIFYLQVTPRLPTKFRVKWPFSSEEGKNRFSRWPPSWISNWNDLTICISTSHPNASYQFSNQLALWFRKISDKKSFKMAAMVVILDFRSKQFKLFKIYKSPKCFLPSFVSNGPSVQEKQKIDFQDGCHGGHLGFLIGMILAIFDLQVTLMLPI